MEDQDSGLFAGKAKQINDSLHTHGARNPCPMCGFKEFTLASGAFVHVLQDNLNSLKISGTSIPTVVLTCGQCGYVMQFAMGALGLMDEYRKEEGPANVQ